MPHGSLEHLSAHVYMQGRLWEYDEQKKKHQSVLLICCPVALQAFSGQFTIYLINQLTFVYL